MGTFGVFLVKFIGFRFEYVMQFHNLALYLTRPIPWVITKVFPGLGSRLTEDLFLTD